jgi:hypothetical protein
MSVERGGTRTNPFHITIQSGNCAPAAQASWSTLKLPRTFHPVNLFLIQLCPRTRQFSVRVQHKKGGTQPDISTFSHEAETAVCCTRF